MSVVRECQSKEGNGGRLSAAASLRSGPFLRARAASARCVRALVALEPLDLNEPWQLPVRSRIAEAEHHAAIGLREKLGEHSLLDEPHTHEAIAPAGNRAKGSHAVDRVDEQQAISRAHADRPF